MRWEAYIGEKGFKSSFALLHAGYRVHLFCADAPVGEKDRIGPLIDEEERILLLVKQGDILAQ